MSVAELKTDLIQLTLETDNPTMLKKVISFFQTLQEKEDWWDNLSENEKTFVQKSAQQIDEGKVVSNDAVREKVKHLLHKS